MLVLHIYSNVEMKWSVALITHIYSKNKPVCSFKLKVDLRACGCGRGGGGGGDSWCGWLRVSVILLLLYARCTVRPEISQQGPFRRSHYREIPFIRRVLLTKLGQGAYRFLKINLRPLLRHFKTNFSGI